MAHSTGASALRSTSNPDLEEPLLVNTGSDTDSDDPHTDPVRRSRNRYAAEGYNIVHNNNTKGLKHTFFRDVPGRGRSPAERQLCVLLVISVLVIIALSVVLVVINLKPASQVVCETAFCMEQAGIMLAKMNTTVDPCVDFFEYSCAAFMQDPRIPPSALKYGMFKEVADTNNAILKKLLDKPGSLFHGVNSTAVKKAKVLYRTCLNVSANEDIPTENLLQVIKTIGSWPVLNNSIAGTWDSTTWMIEDGLSHAFWYLTNPLFAMGVSPDDKNTSVERIIFDQSGTTLSQQDYLGNYSQEYHYAFIKFFTKIVSLLGSKDDVTSDAEEVWQFELELAKAFDSRNDRVDRSALYHLMTVADLQAIIGNVIKLDTYLEKTFKEPVPATEKIIVNAPEYLRKMSKLAAVASPRTLANYIGWHVVVQVIPVMPIQFRLAMQDMQKVRSGTGGGGELWEQCVSQSDELFGFATGALFVQDHLSRQDREYVTDLLANLRSAMEDLLPEVTWMDAQTEAKAVEKLHAIIQKIGYPDFIEDPELLDEYYADLNITLNAPFENAVNTWKYFANKAIERWKKPADKSQWSMGPAEVNAYYSANLNEIVFPAGILQNPFYDPQLPQYYLYGVLGMIISHELTHAFDNTGRLFDLHGNMNNWWTNESAIAFTNKVECLVDEYSKFVVEGEHINGLTTLGENIADNGGLKVAYQAYHNWVDKVGYQELPLPGLNLTIDQMFFLSFSQLWCTYYTPEYAQQALIVDVHSNSKYRVIGTLYNMPQFARAYNCPVGSPMNPGHHCSVW